MSNKTCAVLIARIKQLVGRNITSPNLSLDEIILDALNDAQVRIVRDVPNIMELQVKNTTLSTILNTYSYSFAAFNPPVAHLQNVWILNGLQSQLIRFKDREDFDLKTPDVSAQNAGFPAKWTRRGNAIEFSCPISAEYVGLSIRADYCKWATPFPSTISTATSELVNSDEGLIYFGWAKAIEVIHKDNPNLYREKLAMFESWLEDYSEYHDLSSQEETF
jgi:hypothetical protein